MYWRGLKRDPGAAAWVRRLGMLGQIHQERWPYGVTQSWALAQRESSREQLWCPAGMMEGASAASSHPLGVEKTAEVTQPRCWGGSSWDTLLRPFPGIPPTLHLLLTSDTKSTLPHSNH